MTSGITSSARTSRSLVQGIVVKVGLPLLIGLITLVATHWGGMQVGDALELAAIVAFAVALILFIVDTEVRLSAVAERVTAGFEQTGRLAELSATMERSSLGQPLLAAFLQAAGQVDGRTNPLLQRVARREVERLTAFVRQLQAAAEVSYDGEDRDWLLGLTQEAESSIDAISLSTVDAGVLGLDGGLWTSDLGIRYLDEQHEALARGVRIRRIFVLENEALAHDESFLRVTQMQRNAGVQVRVLDHQLIPDYLQAMIFDFIIFDRVVSYETTPFTAGRPGALQTRLAPDPTRVQTLAERFKKLWEQADPERQIDE
jgi:hypothetical protein